MYIFSFFVQGEIKDYIQNLRVNIPHKTTEKTVKKQPISQLYSTDIRFLNQEALTHAIDNMMSYCDEIINKEDLRRKCEYIYYFIKIFIIIYFNLAQNSEINLNITMADQMSLHSSNKLSEGQTDFKEKLEDNLKFLMNKEADKFLFLNETNSSRNLPRTPNFSGEKLNSTASLMNSSKFFSPLDEYFDERFTETCKKFQINELDVSPIKIPAEIRKNLAIKKTMKKINYIDENIYLQNSVATSEILIENTNNNEKNQDLSEQNKENCYDLSNILPKQIEKFHTYLNNFDIKHPEKFKKTLNHIAKVLSKLDLTAEPEKMRENLEKLKNSSENIEPFNNEFVMESNNSAHSEMKSNLSSFYDSLKKNRLFFENANEERDFFVKYYNEGLNTIEETTENFISKTSNIENLQSKSIQKSNVLFEDEEIDSKALALYKFIVAKSGDKKKIGFHEIVKKCDKNMKIQTFFELLKMNNCNKIELQQENKEKFGEIIVNICS